MPNIASYIPSKSLIGGLCVAFAFCAAAKGCYDSSQHDRRLQATFREEVLKDSSPRLMTVVTDGVTRQGILNKGAAFNSQDSTTALIVAANKQAECWYTTLRVTEGQEKLPFWQKVFGGAESEELFANQAFDNHTCAPTSDASQIKALQTPASAPAPGQ